MSLLKWLAGDNSANDPGKGFEQFMKEKAMNETQIGAANPEEERKKRQQEAIGKILFQTHFSTGEGSSDQIQAPKVNPAGMNYVMPQGLSDSEKGALEAYIQRLRLEQSEGLR